jgi:hypothetical protein
MNNEDLLQKQDRENSVPKEFIVVLSENCKYSTFMQEVIREYTLDTPELRQIYERESEVFFQGSREACEDHISLIVSQLNPEDSLYLRNCFRVIHPK